MHEARTNPAPYTEARVAGICQVEDCDLLIKHGHGTLPECPRIECPHGRQPIQHLVLPRVRNIPESPGNVAIRVEITPETRKLGGRYASRSTLQIRT